MSHKQSNIDIITYVLLNSCSQGTFFTEEALKEMSLKEKGITITGNTLKEKVTENLKVKEGLEVSNSSDFGRGIVRWLRIPRSYTRKDIPVDLDHIIKPDQLSQRKYLDKIKGRL